MFPIQGYNIETNINKPISSKGPLFILLTFLIKMIKNLKQGSIVFQRSQGFQKELFLDCNIKTSIKAPKFNKNSSFWTCLTFFLILVVKKSQICPIVYLLYHGFQKCIIHMAGYHVEISIKTPKISSKTLDWGILDPQIILILKKL